METNWISVLLAGTFIGFSVLAESKEQSKELSLTSMKPSELNTCFVEASASGIGVVKDFKACELENSLRK